MFFRSHLVFKLACGPTDDGSSSSRGQQSSLLQLGEGPPDVQWWSSLFIGVVCYWRFFPRPVTRSRTLHNNHLHLLTRAMAGWMVTLCRPFPVSATRGWSRPALPSQRPLRGWGHPPVHDHAIRGRGRGGLSHRSLTTIQSLRPFRLLCTFQYPGQFWNSGLLRCPDHSKALAWPGKGPCLGLADRSVLFLHTCDKRARLGTGVCSGSGTLPDS